MLENGYSPHNKQDIDAYWQDLLEDWSNEK